MTTVMEIMTMKAKTGMAICLGLKVKTIMERTRKGWTRNDTHFEERSKRI